jgi:hypothetical protein
VTNFGSYAELPDFSVIKIDPDFCEKEMVKQFLEALVEDEDFRHSLGREAASFIREECGIAKCAGEYAHFLKTGRG